MSLDFYEYGELFFILGSIYFSSSVFLNIYHIYISVKQKELNKEHLELRKSESDKITERVSKIVEDEIIKELKK